MLGRIRRLAGASALLLLATAAQAGPVQLDWDDPANAWPATSLNETFTVGGGDVEFTFSGDTLALTSGSPSIQQTPTGGLAPRQNVLLVAADFPSGSSNEIPITINFSHPGGVSKVSFSIFDVDRNGSAVWDEIEVTAKNGPGTINPSSVTIGDPDPAIGNEFIPPNIVRGSSNVANTADQGNATFVFNQSGITRITIVYRYPGPDANPGANLIGLHDIDFTEGAAGEAEPEPVDVRVTKRADRLRTSAGELVRYSITLDNSLAEDLTGISLVDEIPGGFNFVEGSARIEGGGSGLTVDGTRTLTFGGIDLGAGQSATLSYVLRVGAGVAQGSYVNRVTPSIPGGRTSNVSSASVTVSASPEIETTTILGKVFHDRNGDGRQDRGEEGIPGVRLATVAGLLVETDAHGRYHLADVGGGQLERGRNFIIKVDERTLPAGASFTTENPRVRRITQGTPNRFDFGVQLVDHETSCCRIVEVRLGEIHFSIGSDTVRSEFLPLLEELAGRFRATGGGLLRVEGGESQARNVRRTLEKLLGDDLVGKVEIVRAGRRETPPPTGCRADHCTEDEGYDLRVATHPDRPASTGSGRPVTLDGRFSVRLTRGGTVRGTEDPAVIDPRLALVGPDRLPVVDGRISEPGTFYVYSNYTDFIERAELVIYAADDMDRIDPIAKLPVPVVPFGSVEWGGAAARLFRPGDEVSYLLRAYDAEGRFDETRARALHLVDGRDFRSEAPRLLTHSTDAEPSTGRPMVEEAPLAGNVLVLRPPTPVKESSLETRLYTVRPEFDEEHAFTPDADKTELDRIVEEWRSVSNLRIQVTGHTDSTTMRPRRGTEAVDNYAVSEARARTVADYLGGALGLGSGQFAVTGKGPDEPMASNVTATGRELNRRVEVRVSGERAIYAQDGPVDLQLVDPRTGKRAAVTHGLDAAENMLRTKRVFARRSDREPTTPAEVVSHHSAEALDRIYGRNDLEQQNIPIRGSRVRVWGENIGAGHGLIVDGLPIPLDGEGRFAVEQIMPVGERRLEIEVTDGGGTVESRQLPIEVTGRSLFYVALADLTLSGNDFTGSVEPLSGDERFEEDFLAEGRVAGYLKGKIKGKYLITAQLDSTEEELDDLLSNLGDEDPRDIFRRLDPDRFYPVYGDDSTTISDTDSQGRMYVRLDWDHSRALWGNYHTGITGNELAQYNRSLYGAKLHYKSLRTTSGGDPRTDATAFGSEPQTALGHSELLGTGGSLYYLRHRDILPGSDKARIEVRDRDSRRVIENITLVRGSDYEIDELQGRIMLARPLLQIAEQVAPSLIRDTPLDGNDAVMLVDYEYVPDGFDADEVTAGARGKHWLNDHLAVGGTYLEESRSVEDYQLYGADVTLATGRGTYIKAEYAETEASQAPRFFSDNGGLTYRTLNPTAEATRSGEAYVVEARANFKELAGTKRDWIAAAWYRSSDEGFSVARRDSGEETTEYGAEMVGQAGEKLRLAIRASVTDREETLEDQRYSVQSDYRVTKRGTLSAEVRHLRERPTSDPEFTEATLGAVRYAHRVTDKLDLYATGQVTVDDDDARYEENDLGTLGARLRVGNRTNLRLEGSSGDRGEGGTLALEHQLNPDHRLYGAYTMSTDRTDAPRSNRLTFGQRSRLSNRTTVFTESQFARVDEHSGIARVFGLDFAPKPAWSVGLSAQNGELTGTGGVVDRDAATFSVGYSGKVARWFSTVEFRNDEGAEEREQWVSSNRLDWKLGESTRLLTRFNFSDTEDALSGLDDARFVESGVGIAYRPVRHDRFNLLGKYTFLYDLPGADQDRPGTDQRSHVFSLESIWDVTAKWEIGSKLARRESELRADRGEGEWFESGASFAALRTSYHLVSRWDLLLEYRVLDADDDESLRQGFLAGLDRHLGEHFKVGVGYNFTDFSDDLTELDYDFNGWFANFVTKY